MTTRAHADDRPRYSWQWRSLRRRTAFQHDDDNYNPPGPFCAACGTDCLPPGPADLVVWHRYMVHDEVWAAAGMHEHDGWLCVDCLERRLGRQRTADDLQDVPLNNPGDAPDPPRLAVAKAEAALARAWRRLDAQHSG